ncbi:E3 ubiquitin-protein ligase hrd1 [Tulasnella sp. 418]|nr:E3 ubiquitin-protein ligase hrd1 [Tulasnella sp. 418]
MPLTSLLSSHRTSVYALFSTFLVSGVVLNAFLIHSNFYSVAVYLSKSSGSVLALANFGFLVTLAVGKVLQQIFFGPLRQNELEHLYDRAWFFITESLLAFTIFRDQFNAVFGIMFVGLLFLKCFHWVAADRIETMDQVPYPGPGLLFHIRTVALLITLWLADTLVLLFCIEHVASAPELDWVILFVCEYCILLACQANAFLKYCINLYDLRRAHALGGENAPLWEDKSMCMFYVELITDFIKLLTYLIFFGVVMSNYGLPLNVVRDVYVTAKSFISRVKDLIQYRNATRNMDQRYPNATQEELDAMSDRTCIICREEMTLQAPAEQQATDGSTATAPAPTTAQPGGPNDTPKKLPCGHVFHFHCLRSWLERQQSCPTCRRSVLETPAPPTPAAPAQPNVPQVPGNPNVAANANALLNRFGIRPGAPIRNIPAPQAAAGTGTQEGSGTPSAQNVPPAPAPRVFEGFNVNGVWQPWNVERPGQAQPPAADADPQAPSTQPSSTTSTSSANADPTPTPTSTTEPTSLDARQAAAAAALRRFGSSSGTSSPAPPTPTSTTAPTPTTSQPTTSAASKPSLPTLIPLFDPSAITPAVTQRQPFGFSSPFSGFPFTNSNASTSFIPPQTNATPASSSALPPELTDDQLARLDKLTREGIDERLRILEGVQQSIWRSVEDLTKLRSVLPPVDSSSLSDNQKGKSKES